MASARFGRFCPPSSSAVVTPSGDDTLQSVFSQEPFFGTLSSVMLEWWCWLRWNVRLRVFWEMAGSPASWLFLTTCFLAFFV